MKEILDKSQKILVATEPDADFDDIVSAVSLARILQDSKKQVLLFLPRNQYCKRVLEKFPLQDLKVLDINTQKSFVLTIKKKNAVVKNVRWKEEGGKINIYIDTINGQIDSSNFKIKTKPFVVDLIITVNIRSLKKFGRGFYKHFKKHQILQIGHIDKNLGTFKFGFNTNISSVLIYEFLIQNNFSISPTVATNLISAILWKSHGFRFAQDPSVINAFYKLSLIGNIKIASRSAYSNMYLEDTKLIQAVVQNLKITNKKIAYSLLSSVNFPRINIENVIYHNWIIINDLKDIDLVFILIKKDEATYGVIISKTTKFNAKEIAIEFSNVKGNLDRVSFVTKKNIKTVKDEILYKVGVNSGTQIKNHIDKLNQNNDVTNKDPLAPASVEIEPLRFY